MKKKLWAVLCSAALSLSLLAGCGGAAGEEKTQEAENAEQSSAQEQTGASESADGGALAQAADSDQAVGAEGARKLIVGFDAEFPPYGYKDDNGDYTGFDLEVAQEVCGRLGWELVKQPIDWDAKDMELSSGAIDCIWNGFTMSGREDDYTWTVPYVDNSQVFVVAADAGIGKKAELAGKVVGVQKDSSALAALQDEENQENLELAASFAELIEYADYNTAFMDLEAGAIDAVALDIGVASYQMSSREGKFVRLDEQLSTEQYAVGFLKGNTELKNQVEAVLLELSQDGTFMKIAERYADYGVPESVCLGDTVPGECELP